MTTRQAAATAPDLINEGRSAFCHVVCGVHDNRTLCGLTDDSDVWCTADHCNNVCLVCSDLEGASPCPICGTDCAPTDERNTQ